ncbi:uncharacterized protein LOC113212325 [Frankliniella occidentalis]|uniref:Uncharacterized protein LOC113212325 n=1 Tax=Frankliniella occidentalis TaxID=133901 RepID=A0A9C6WW57_FRAOC|nr:uncharacterized protein LOC113212325 [Frankliniella occidentalis]
MLMKQELASVALGGQPPGTLPPRRPCQCPCAAGDSVGPGSAAGAGGGAAEDPEENSPSSDENLPYLDASDTIPDPDDEDGSSLSGTGSGGSTPRGDCGGGGGGGGHKPGVNYSFVHSVYHTQETHEEAILIRMQKAGTAQTGEPGRDGGAVAVVPETSRARQRGAPDKGGHGGDGGGGGSPRAHDAMLTPSTSLRSLDDVPGEPHTDDARAPEELAEEEKEIREEVVVAVLDDFTDFYNNTMKRCSARENEFVDPPREDLPQDAPRPSPAPAYSPPPPPPAPELPPGEPAPRRQDSAEGLGHASEFSTADSPTADDWESTATPCGPSLPASPRLPITRNGRIVFPELVLPELFDGEPGAPQLLCARPEQAMDGEGEAYLYQCMLAMADLGQRAAPVPVHHLRRQQLRPQPQRRQVPPPQLQPPQPEGWPHLGLYEKLKHFAHTCRPLHCAEGDDGLPQVAMTAELNRELLRRMSCARCGLHTVPPVLQCAEGHFLCHDCRPAVPEGAPLFRCTVPQGGAHCGARLPPAMRGRPGPCRMFNGLARSVRYPCRYAPQGCPAPQDMDYLSKAAHEATCAHRQVRCYLGECRWRGLWSRQRAHLVAEHAAEAVAAHWYRLVEVLGRGRAPPPPGLGRTFASSRCCEVVLLAGPAAAEASIFLVHALELPGGARYTVQGLGPGPCCRYRLRFTCEEQELEARGRTLRPDEDADLELRSGRCFRLDRDMFGCSSCAAGHRTALYLEKAAALASGEGACA